jgi:hypothetical protein
MTAAALNAGGYRPKTHNTATNRSNSASVL